MINLAIRSGHKYTFDGDARFRQATEYTPRIVNDADVKQGRNNNCKRCDIWWGCPSGV